MRRPSASVDRRQAGRQRIELAALKKRGRKPHYNVDYHVNAALATKELDREKEERQRMVGRSVGRTDGRTDRQLDVGGARSSETETTPCRKSGERERERESEGVGVCKGRGGGGALSILADTASEQGRKKASAFSRRSARSLSPSARSRSTYWPWFVALAAWRATSKDAGGREGNLAPLAA